MLELRLPTEEDFQWRAERIGVWLRERIGYGSFDAKYWFVGMEEACTCEHELDMRLQGRAVEDLELAHRRLPRPHEDLFGARAKIQRTWRPLIRLYLSMQGLPADENDRVLRRQKREWGRSEGSTLLAELFPLPSPSTGVWLRYYEELAPRLPELRSRSRYQHQWRRSRTELLQGAVRTHRPHVLVGYGSSNRDVLKEIAGGAGAAFEDEWHSPDGLAFVKDGKPWCEVATVRVDGHQIIAVAAAHPNDRDYNIGGDSKWIALGTWIRSALAL